MRLSRPRLKSCRNESASGNALIKTNMKVKQIGENLYVPEDFSKNHYYYADADGKKKYTGVTTVINVLAKPALIGWAARMAAEYIQAVMEKGEPITLDVIAEAKVAHTKKKEAAGEAGTDAHALVEDFVKRCIEINAGAPQDMGLEVDKPIEKFVEWAKENVKTFLFSERQMADIDLFLAGTCDFAYIGKDGKRYMADFKTSSGVYGIDFWLQTAAYRMLAEKNGDEPYDACVVVRMGKDGSFEVLRMFDYETCKNAFLSCLTLYRAQANLKNIAVKDPTTTS